MAHKVWKCMKCNAIPETGLEMEVRVKKNTRRLCKKCGGTVKWIKATSEDKLEQVKYFENEGQRSQYDEELKEKCELFRLHEFSLPHIPGNYGKEGSYKVLQVAESNYIDDAQYSGDVIEDFFRNWWTKELHISELAENNPELDWVGDYTRYVLYSFGMGYSDLFGIYAKPAELVLKIRDGISRPQNNKDIGEYHNQLRKFYYENIAFTDFFKVPSIERGKSIKEMIEPIKRQDPQMFCEIITNSVKCLNAVVEVLKPDYILFTSDYGYSYYSNPEYNPEYERLFAGSEDKIKRLCHTSALSYPNKNAGKIEMWNKVIEEVFTK